MGKQIEIKNIFTRFSKKKKKFEKLSLLYSRKLIRGERWKVTGLYLCPALMKGKWFSRCTRSSLNHNKNFHHRHCQIIIHVSTSLTFLPFFSSKSKQEFLNTKQGEQTWRWEKPHSFPPKRKPPSSFEIWLPIDLPKLSFDSCCCQKQTLAFVVTNFDLYLFYFVFQRTFVLPTPKIF